MSYNELLKKVISDFMYRIICANKKLTLQNKHIHVALADYVVKVGYTRIWNLVICTMSIIYDHPENYENLKDKDEMVEWMIECVGGDKSIAELFRFKSDDDIAKPKPEDLNPD